MLRAALRSTWSRWPQPTQAKTAWLSRFAASVWPQAWHCCEVKRGSTNRTWAPDASPLSLIRWPSVPPGRAQDAAAQPGLDVSLVGQEGTGVVRIGLGRGLASHRRDACVGQRSWLRLAPWPGGCARVGATPSAGEPGGAAGPGTVPPGGRRSAVPGSAGHRSGSTGTGPTRTSGRISRPSADSPAGRWYRGWRSPGYHACCASTACLPGWLGRRTRLWPGRSPAAPAAGRSTTRCRATQRPPGPQPTGGISRQLTAPCPGQVATRTAARRPGSTPAVREHSARARRTAAPERGTNDS
jgi:hypothetical protein